MWPLLLDMTKEESIRNLRNLELEAYSHLISALRAQGPLNPDKRKLLKDTGYVLNISNERHKAEVRRAISDERLNTIAYHITGHTESVDDWAQEGRRIVPLLPRPAPQTAYSALADEASEAASQSNNLLPAPASTERKRQSSVNLSANNAACETTKNSSFRIPDPPKTEESKKRKMAPTQESIITPHHRLHNKMSKIQEIYSNFSRKQSRSKARGVDSHKKTEQDHVEMISSHQRLMAATNQPQMSSPQPQFMNQKVNVLQNFSFQPMKEESIGMEEYSRIKTSDPVIMQPPSGTNENQAPRLKVVTNIKPNMNITVKQPTLSPAAGPSNDIHKSLKFCSGKKSITKTTVQAGQKLIVVSTNAQTIQPSNSILQRTLQIPIVKNVSIKNFEKFKIVTSSATQPPPSTIQVTNVTNSSSGMNSVKHKVVTVKTNSNNKKIIPLSQLQVLNSKGGIKVLPIGGKIVGKTMTAAATSSPLYIMNTTPLPKSNTPTAIPTTLSNNTQEVQNVKAESEDLCNNTAAVAEKVAAVSNFENGKYTVVEDMLQSSSSSDIIISDNDNATNITDLHNIPQLLTDNGVSEEHIVDDTLPNNANQIETIDQCVDEFDYNVLPMETIEDDSQENDLDHGNMFEHDHHQMDVTETEIIEEESSLVNEVVESDVTYEEIPQVIYQVECSKMSENTEHIN